MLRAVQVVIREPDQESAIHTLRGLSALDGFLGGRTLPPAMTILYAWDLRGRWCVHAYFTGAGEHAPRGADRLPGTVLSEDYTGQMRVVTIPDTMPVEELSREWG